MNGFLRQALQFASHWTLPLLFIAIPLCALWRRVQVYETFVQGAREGFRTGVRIAPYLLAMLVAIGAFRAAGGLQLLARLLTPLMGPLGIPPEVVPLGLMRPFSGSASLGMLTDLLKTHGPDSPLGLAASVIQGSTETTFYVLTIYTGAVGLRRLGHTWAAGLAADLVGFVTAVLVARLFF